MRCAFLFAVQTVIASIDDVGVPSATPWGGDEPFPRYASSNMSYVVRKTPVRHPGPACTNNYPINCYRNAISVLERFRDAHGHQNILDIQDKLGVTARTVRKCVTQKLGKVLRSIYISASMLEWLVEINRTGIMFSKEDFVSMYDRKCGKSSPNSETSTVVTQKLNVCSKLNRPLIDPLNSSRCDLHLWYTDVLLQHVNRPLRDMQLTSVPWGATDVIAPSAEIVKKMINSQINKLRSSREIPVRGTGGSRMMKASPIVETATSLEDSTMFDEFLKKETFLDTSVQQSIIRSAEYARLDHVPSSPSTLSYLMEIIGEEI